MYVLAVRKRTALAIEGCFLLCPYVQLAHEGVTDSNLLYEYLKVHCPLLPLATVVAVGAHEDSRRWHGAQ